MGTLTTMTPESSTLNHSQDYNLKLSGKKLGGLRRIAPQIEVKSNFWNLEDNWVNSPIDSRNSKELHFYNNFTNNPISEGPEICFEQKQLTQNRTRKQQNFSFNENGSGNLKLHQNYKSNTNIKIKEENVPLRGRT